MSLHLPTDVARPLRRLPIYPQSASRPPQAPPSQGRAPRCAWTRTISQCGQPRVAAPRRATCPFSDSHRFAALPSCADTRAVSGNDPTSEVLSPAVASRGAISSNAFGGSSYARKWQHKGYGAMCEYGFYVCLRTLIRRDVDTRMSHGLLVVAPRRSAAFCGVRRPQLETGTFAAYASLQLTALITHMDRI